MRLILTSTVMFAAAFSTFSQTKKIVGYKQLANDIFFSDKKEVCYDNIHFINDLPGKGEESFLSTYFNPISSVKIYGGFKKFLESKGANKDSLGFFHSKCKSIKISDCIFDNDIRFSNVMFEGDLYFSNNEFPTISEDFVGLYGQAFGGAILIDSCKFNGFFQLLFRKQHDYRFYAKFNHSVFNAFHLELQKSTTQIKQSFFSKRLSAQIHDESILRIDSSSFGYFEKGQPMYLELDDIRSVSITNSNFVDSSDLFFNFYLFAKFIELDNNRFDANTDLAFDNSEVFIDHNKFLKKLTLDFNSIEKRSYVNLYSLNNLVFGTLHKEDYYDATTKNQVYDDAGYKKYLRINKALYDYFKDVGDIGYANQTYVRIREIENGKLNIMYDSIPTFQNLFSLNLNRLLKFYTNYGTDPAKALVVSFYLVLLFGIFYFFFPSDWDVTSKSKLIQNFKDFIEKNEKGYFKPFLTLTIGVTISIINATTLSLNAFTTLGFGNIPTHGLARYICVIQGFIGWFLLSIFTVALINQAQF